MPVIWLSPERFFFLSLHMYNFYFIHYFCSQTYNTRYGSQNTHTDTIAMITLGMQAS